MTLTLEQLAKREGKITASWAPYLMKGDRARILSEWKRLVYDEFEEPPFDPWRSKYGAAIEPLALDHHQEKTGRALSRRGEVVMHPDRPYCCATLDSYRADDDTVIDCKAWSSWQKVDYICSFLVPQMIVQRACVQCQNAALLLVHGGAEPVEYPLSWESEYEEAVWERIEWFWDHVQSLTSPYELPSIEPAASVIATKTYDMQTSNAWSENAGLWLENRAAAGVFSTAATELKELVPGDARKAVGHGVLISRNKNGALSIKGIKQ